MLASLFYLISFCILTGWFVDVGFTAVIVIILSKLNIRSMLQACRLVGVKKEMDMQAEKHTETMNEGSVLSLHVI